MENLQMQPWMEEIEPNMLPEPYHKIYEIIGLAATIKLAFEFQGTNVYFAKMDGTIKAIRDKRIRDEYNGYNIKDLVKKYGLTETWVRQILSENPVESNQGSLWEMSG